MGVVLKRAKYFITVNGEFFGFRKDRPDYVRNLLAEGEKPSMYQMKLFNL